MPHEHVTIAGENARAGLAISEYPPDTAPLAFHFQMRNRLISGLSRAVVVIEANERSGSLIAAACALEQGREVMAVPGNVLSGRNQDAHALIHGWGKDCGVCGRLQWKNSVGRGQKRRRGAMHQVMPSQGLLVIPYCG